jgi:MFS family permease
MTQCWLDTGSIGAITLMPSFVARFGELSPLVRGFVVACILIPSGELTLVSLVPRIMIFHVALSGVIAGPISDRISRKYSISLGAGIFTVGQTMSTASPGLGVLIVGRCISGVGEVSPTLFF